MAGYLRRVAVAGLRPWSSAGGLRQALVAGTVSPAAPLADPMPQRVERGADVPRREAPTAPAVGVTRTGAPGEGAAPVNAEPAAAAGGSPAEAPLKGELRASPAAAMPQPPPATERRDTFDLWRLEMRRARERHTEPGGSRTVRREPPTPAASMTDARPPEPVRNEPSPPGPGALDPRQAFLAPLPPDPQGFRAPGAKAAATPSVATPQGTPSPDLLSAVPPLRIPPLTPAAEVPAVRESSPPEPVADESSADRVEARPRRSPIPEPQASASIGTGARGTPTATITIGRMEVQVVNHRVRPVRNGRSHDPSQLRKEVMDPGALDRFRLLP
jgi:hypothetical protein